MKQIIGTMLLLLLAGLLFGQWQIDEGFEGITSLPTGWTFHDDGDGMTWRNLNHANAHSGSRAAFVDNYLPNQNADWLVTPQISVNPGDSMVFFTRSWVGTENLKVFASTTGAMPANFTQQLIHVQNIGTTYQEVSLALDQFAGLDIYLAFFWQCTSYGILVDDVKIGQPLNVTPELNLPATVSFFHSNTLTMDFSEYVVCTDINAASLSVSPNPDLNILIDGFTVSMSSIDFVGSTEVTFTLLDHVNSLTATDDITVVVEADPNVDLYVQSVISPRNIEYLNLPMIPQIEIGNLGLGSYNNQVEVQLTVYNPEGTAIHTDTAISTVDISPAETVQITFGNPFTPTQEGNFAFHFQIMSQDDFIDNNLHIHPCAVVLRITTGGPDTFGYRFVDSNDPLGPEFDWIDISETGTSSVMYEVPSWAGDDNFSEPIPLGFNFPFYGSAYTTAYVDINGEILLASNTWYTPYPNQGWNNDGNMFNYMYPIPGYNQMPGLIAVYWDDLHADQGVGNVYFQSFGEAPNRYAVIQWHNVRFHAGTGGDPALKFQVILHENGDIKMQYHTVSTGQTGASIPHDNGLSATIAIQNAAANTGLTYLREIVQNSTYIGVEPAGNLLHDNLAILFYGGTDEQAPIITHKAVGNTFSQNMDLSATILDMSPIVSGTIHYDYGLGWQSLNAASIDQLDYTFSLEGLPLGATVKYYFQAEDEHGNLSRLPLSAPTEYYSFKILPTGAAQVLIAYSGTQDYQRIELPVYEAMLTGLNIPYDIYNWEEYDVYSIPAQYQGVLAYANTGSVSPKMYYFASVLMDYLDLGTVQSPKNLWFSSDGLASSQHAHPNSSDIRRMMSGYFRTSYVATGFGGGTNGLGGPNSYSYEHGTILALPGTQVGTPGVEYAVYANSPDCIFPNNAAGDPYYDDVPYPEIGANYVYAFEDGPFNGQAYLYHGVAATTVETPSFRTMYFSFDFSQLTSSAARAEWISDLMSWWNISPVTNSDSQSPHLLSGIDSIYPNPFNPTTTISFTLSSNDLVDMNVYNIRGQKVRSLLHEARTAGKHSIVWDGKDDKGQTVASGVYYLRMEANDTRVNRKLTLIK